MEAARPCDCKQCGEELIQTVFYIKIKKNISTQKEIGIQLISEYKELGVDL